MDDETLCLNRRLNSIINIQKKIMQQSTAGKTSVADAIGFQILSADTDRSTAAS